MNNDRSMGVPFMLVALLLFCGCVPTEDRSDFAHELNLSGTGETTVNPPGWVKHDPVECKFSFGQDVVVTHGFYKGQSGAVMDLREDGYVVDIYGYRGLKPNGYSVHRHAVIYGIPESHLEPDANAKVR